MIEKSVVIDNPIRCLKVSCEREIIAYGTADSLHIHNIASKAKMEIRHQSPVDDICLGQVDDIIVTLSYNDDNTMLRIINTSSKSVIASSAIKFKVKRIQQAGGLIALSCDKKVYVLDVAKLAPKYAEETFDNATGMFGISQQLKTLSMVFPRQKIGHARVVNLRQSRQGPLVRCHSGQITYLTMTKDGTRFCSCSVKRNVARIFNAQTGEKVQQVWVGSKKHDIMVMAFSVFGDWLAMITRNGHLKIYSAMLLPAEKQESAKEFQATNPKSSFSFLSGIFESLGQEQQHSSYDFGVNISDRLIDVEFRQNTAYVAILKPSEKLVKVLTLKFDPLYGGHCFKSHVETV